MEYKAATPISARMIADIVTTAVETPFGDWCLRFDLKSPAQDSIPGEGPWYAREALYGLDHFEIEVLEDEEDSGDPKRAKVHTITPESIQKGLDLMASDYPTAFSEFVTEYDAITADAFLQLVTMGDVVYG